jgi:NTP pyrophosphatase (non-canonical NTP hydrolase)
MSDESRNEFSDESSDESANDSQNPGKPDVLAELLESVASFCEERDWDQFHDAKELAIGLVTESAELLEHFRFKSTEEFECYFSDPAGAGGKREAIEDELADILFFVLRFSGRYEIDLASAMKRKLEKNALKYPVEKSRGSNRKYDEL